MSETMTEEASGHSRQLRLNLKAAREAAGISQDEVGRRISERLQREKPYTGASVSAWELFIQHPPIDVMAAWARAVGLRLVVNLDSARSSRVAVLLRPESADMARALDAAPEADREFIRSYLKRIEML